MEKLANIISCIENNASEKNRENAFLVLCFIQTAVIKTALQR